ncbi:hypothetical protein Q8F55_003394 [Vanrija albida]|uniref:Uncharacterized protein n=1 Tax=Vanrija albida TaxID=181172 RepID=A0ABR3Q4N4_9TREE
MAQHNETCTILIPACTICTPAECLGNSVDPPAAVADTADYEWWWNRLAPGYCYNNAPPRTMGQVFAHRFPPELLQAFKVTTDTLNTLFNDTNVKEAEAVCKVKAKGKGKGKGKNKAKDKVKGLSPDTWLKMSVNFETGYRQYEAAMAKNNLEHVIIPPMEFKCQYGRFLETQQDYNEREAT